MKKIIGLLSLSFVLFLAACSSDEQTVSTEKKESNQTETKQEAKQESKEEAKEIAKIEMVEETFNVWKDSIDTVWVNYSAKVKNTGTAPASINDIQVNFEDGSEAVLGTASMITPTPDIIAPGETAYITETTTLDTVTDPSAVTKAYANIDFDTTETEPYYLTTSNVTLKNNTNEYADDTPYVVTGSVINEGDVKADDVRIAAGLYDESGKLIAVLDTSLDISLAPGGKAGFTLDYPGIAPSLKGKAKTVEVIAHNWDW